MTTGLVAGQDLEALAAWADQLPAYVANGVTCDEVSPGLVRLRMKVADHFLNPSGAINGGVLSFFADQMGGLGASTLVSVDRGPVTLNLSCNYLAPAMGDELTGVGRVTRAGRTIAFLDFEVEASGRTCMTATGVWLLTAARGPRDS